MSASSSSSKTAPPVIHRSKITGADEGRIVVSIEFKQARYHFKWRKYMCAMCGALHSEHHEDKAKAKMDDDTEIREEHLPPLKRLMLRYERDQKALAATARAREKDKEDEEDEELEEGEIRWSPGVTTTKGKRAPRRKRADAP